MTDSRWNNVQAFTRWLSRFQESKARGPCKLLLDGNGAHKIFKIYNFVRKKNKILMVHLPIHNTETSIAENVVFQVIGIILQKRMTKFMQKTKNKENRVNSDLEKKS
jgi:hypothetical protein